LITEWDNLTPRDKDGNYNPVRRRLIAITCNYEIKRNPKLPTRATYAKFINSLLASEHNIWLADHLVIGAEQESVSTDHLLQHTDIKSFEKLPEKQQRLNRKIIQITIAAIEKAGYRIVPKTKPPRRKNFR